METSVKVNKNPLTGSRSHNCMSFFLAEEQVSSDVTQLSATSSFTVSPSVLPSPEIVSSPDITAPQSTSEDGPPLAALATATSLALVIILLLLALSSVIIWRKRRLNREKSQRYEYC